MLMCLYTSSSSDSAVLEGHEAFKRQSFAWEHTLGKGLGLLQLSSTSYLLSASCLWRQCDQLSLIPVLMPSLQLWTIVPQTVIQSKRSSIYYFFGQVFCHRSKKKIQKIGTRIGVFVSINLTMWFFCLQNQFVRGVQVSVELQHREVLGCYKQILIGYSSRSSEEESLRKCDLQRPSHHYSGDIKDSIGHQASSYYFLAKNLTAFCQFPSEADQTTNELCCLAEETYLFSMKFPSSIFCRAGLMVMNPFSYAYC